MAGTVYLVLLILSSVEGAKILLFPQTYVCDSHITNMQKMGKVLTSAGHQTHIIFPEMCNHLKLSGTRLVYLSLIASTQTLTHTKVSYPDQMLNASAVSIVDISVSLNFHFCRDLMADDELMDRLISEKYDLGIFDLSDTCSTILIQHITMPIIVYSDIGHLEHIYINIPAPLSYYPLVWSRSTGSMSFAQRLCNTIEYLLPILMAEVYVYRPLNSAAAKLGYNFTWTSNHIADRVAAYFINTNSAFEYPRPLLPNAIQIGGLMASPAKALPRDLDQVAQSAKNGVIVVSFSSNLTLPSDVINRFAHVFSTLKYRIIWRHALPKPETVGKNTYVKARLSENDLLGHPRTKLFITNCGMTSVQEAVYHAVPIVAVPVYGDQFHQANKVVWRGGMGRQVDLWTVSTQQLRDAIFDVLQNATYKENAKRLSALYRDQPQPVRETFLYWVDYVKRHGYTDHLHATDAWQLNWFQYFLVDVSIVLTLGVLIVLIVLFSTAVCITKCACYLYRRKNKEEE